MLKPNKLLTTKYCIPTNGPIKVLNWNRLLIVGFSIFIALIFVYLKTKQPVTVITQVQEPKVFVETGSTEFKQAILHWVDLEKKKNSKLDKTFLESIANYAVHSSILHGLEPMTMLAVITVESRFDIFAKSNAGAMGLAQIIPYWHQDKLKGLDVYDPKTNIEVGAKILAEYKKMSKNNINEALKRYNGSLGLVTDYDKKVLTKKKELDSFILASVKQSLKTENFTVQLGE